MASKNNGDELASQADEIGSEAEQEGAYSREDDAQDVRIACTMMILQSSALAKKLHYENVRGFPAIHVNSTCCRRMDSLTARKKRNRNLP